MTNVAEMVDEPIHRGELLLELLSEEIPARMQLAGLERLKERVTESLEGAYLAPATVVGYVTPRRLTIVATGISQQQDASDALPDERRGPRVGAPEAAVKGFCRSVGLDPEDLEQRDGYYFAKIERPGSAAMEILPKVITEALEETVWPKSMRFPACTLHWVRPIVSVICLFDGKIIPLALDQVPVGRTTRGHRFLSPGEITVTNAEDYLARLEAAHVILDHDRRRSVIAAGLDRLAKSEGITVKPDPGLLDEVAGLVEFPVVLLGAIDAASMALPPEVLATAMRTHQKYFSCLNPDGTTAPRFLFVANNLTTDHGKTIVAGNERVLRARLADARFFWEQDRKVRLENRLDQLRERVYHAQLGNLFDKSERIELLAEFLVEHVPGAGRRRAQRAALLAKADLSTGMVGEFPELQGVMGRYYALNDGENARVAEAIADHYKPLGPNDTCPTTPESIVVALADKIDALFGFFWINEKPSGSRDPFALRRAAQGIIRVILENGLRLPLIQALKCVHTIFTNHQSESLNATGKNRYLGVGPFVSDVSGEVIEFIADRLKVHLRDRGVRHDLISAVFALGEDDLVRLLARVEALSKFLSAGEGTNLLTAYRRASNIVAIEERRDDRRYNHDVDQALLKQREEHALFADLDLVSGGVRRALEREEFQAAMGHLATMRRSVDEFFDEVTVNTDDAKLRENRLRLLSRIRAVMNQVADFSQIEG